MKKKRQPISVHSPLPSFGASAPTPIHEWWHNERAAKLDQEGHRECSRSQQREVEVHLEASKKRNYSPFSFFGAPAHMQGAIFRENSAAKLDQGRRIERCSRSQQRKAAGNLEVLKEKDS